MDQGITYELVHPKRFIISQEIYDQGRLVNCFGAVMKHVWNISFNTPVIEKKDICKRIEQLSGCHLVELLLFNPNKIRKINTNKRARHNKLLKKFPGHKFIPTKKIDYWRIFEVNVGCLLLECSIRSNGAYDHLLVLNFLNNYVYECGYEYQPFTKGNIEKANALKILSKFNIADINRVWLITRRNETRGVQTKSIYGNLNMAKMVYEE
jgi:hypothetical protein